MISLDSTSSPYPSLVWKAQPFHTHHKHGSCRGGDKGRWPIPLDVLHDNSGDWTFVVKKCSLRNGSH